MASVRLKKSKIPLREDTRLKNISKIPVPVEAKPKILISTEAKLKSTSAAVKKNPSLNPLDRRKKPVLIPPKEVKGANLQIKVKAKENRFQPSTKVSLLSKELNKNKTSKTSAENEWTKNSNPVSQVLKNRNKVTTEKAPERPKPINDPFLSFKKKMPEINFSEDDPFKSSAKEKKVKNFNHPSQQNIEFVADERMKNHILNNRELTPGILKSSSNVKTSVMERPSIYKRLKIPVDPYKQALADIAKCDLASERRRPSEMEKNRLCTSPSQNRGSIYKRLKLPVDPYKQALADIAKCDLVSEERRFSEMAKNRLCLSPLQNRNSLYKPVKFVGDPFKEALKSLKNLRMHQKIKSSKKKVTFNLSGEDRSETKSKNENNEENAVNSIEPSLTRTNEKSRGSSTRSTPEFQGNILLVPDGNPLEKSIGDSPSTSPERVFGSRPINATCLPNKTDSQEDDVLCNKTSVSTSPCLIKTIARDEKGMNDSSPLLSQRQIMNKDIIQDIQDSNRNTLNTFLNLQLASEVRQSLISSRPERCFNKMNRKIFTPQPISFYPQAKLPECIVSPEILSKRTTDILSCAPINTPLVLRGLGKLELSPVCKKLEFKDSPKDTNKEDSRENSQTFYLQNIMTQQKILEQLAHQECSIFMHEATFPCETRNFLQNPIAQILNDGDETHFVPVSLQRLS